MLLMCFANTDRLDGSQRVQRRSSNAIPQMLDNMFDTLLRSRHYFRHFWTRSVHAPSRLKLQRTSLQSYARQDATLPRVGHKLSSGTRKQHYAASEMAPYSCSNSSSNSSMPALPHFVCSHRTLLQTHTNHVADGPNPKNPLL